MLGGKFKNEVASLFEPSLQPSSSLQSHRMDAFAARHPIARWTKSSFGRGPDVPRNSSQRIVSHAVAAIAACRRRWRWVVLFSKPPRRLRINKSNSHVASLMRSCSSSRSRGREGLPHGLRSPSTPLLAVVRSVESVEWQPGSFGKVITLPPNMALQLTWQPDTSLARMKSKGSAGLPRS
jgi:hypothetical protein